MDAFSSVVQECGFVPQSPPTLDAEHVKFRIWQAWLSLRRRAFTVCVCVLKMRISASVSYLAVHERSVLVELIVTAENHQSYCCAVLAGDLRTEPHGMGMDVAESSGRWRRGARSGRSVSGGGTLAGGVRGVQNCSWRKRWWRDGAVLERRGAACWGWPKCLASDRSCCARLMVEFFPRIRHPKPRR